MKNYSINNGVVSFLLILVFAFFACPNSYADKKKKKEKKETSQTEYKGDVGTTITLVTSGTGETKEEATKNALRSALEQTYGAFVSSNSKVVNDELVSDEIVSISTGNIAKYEILSFVDSSPMQVTTKAVVSISNLQSYAQNKGMSAELAGNTFAMNVKIEELNKKNEESAMEHLYSQLELSSNNLFDYKIEVGSPEIGEVEVQESNYYFRKDTIVKVPVTLKIVANENTLAFYDLLHGTLSGLSLKNAHLGHVLAFPDTWSDQRVEYHLRSNRYSNHEIVYTIDKAAFNCVIVDNIGSKFCFRYTGRPRRHIPNVCFSDRYGHVVLTLGNMVPASSYYGVSRIYTWLGSQKPSVGDLVHIVKLILNYSMEQISKVSKIEVKPGGLIDTSKRDEENHETY